MMRLKLIVKPVCSGYLKHFIALSNNTFENLTERMKNSDKKTESMDGTLTITTKTNKITISR